MPNREQTGFTLLEIMIALGVVGLLMSALYGSYRAVADSILGIQPQAMFERKGRFFIQQLSRQVRCCYGGFPNSSNQSTARENRTGADLGEREAFFQGNEIASHAGVLLRYVTSSGTRTTGRYPECLTAVSYRLDRWRHVLSVREELFGSRRAMDDENWRDVLDDVLDVEFEYFDGHDWHSEWDSNASGGLPKAVSVSLVLQSSQGDHAEMTSVISILCSGSRAGKVQDQEVPAQRKVDE